MITSNVPEMTARLWILQNVTSISSNSSVYGISASRFLLAPKMGKVDEKLKQGLYWIYKRILNIGLSVFLRCIQEKVKNCVLKLFTAQYGVYFDKDVLKL